MTDTAAAMLVLAAMFALVAWGVYLARRHQRARRALLAALRAGGPAEARELARRLAAAGGPGLGGESLGAALADLEDDGLVESSASGAPAYVGGPRRRVYRAVRAVAGRAP